MLIGGINMVLSAPRANMLEMALALILGVGGAVLMSGGSVVLAVMATKRAQVIRVDDTTGPIPTIG